MEGMMDNIDTIERILITEDEILRRVKELANQINKDFENKPMLVIVILKGSVMFASDLVRHFTSDVEIDFMRLSSYGDSSVSSGNTKIITGLNMNVDQKNVLIIEDIIDTGYTIEKLKEVFSACKPNMLKICSLLNKPSRRKVEIEADYIGFDIEDEFVVGYGLDYAQKYRNLPYIGILKREVYE